MIVEHRNSLIEFPDSIHIVDQEFSIEVELLKKRSSSVTVKESTLVFRLSSSLSKHEVRDHFSELLEKISKKVSKKPALRSIKTFDQVLTEGRFDFAGEEYWITRLATGRGVKLRENAFLVGPKVSDENLKKYITKLLIEKFERRIKEYVLSYNTRTYNYPVKDVELKLVESKWGHCSYDNTIMLNLKLLNAPTGVLDYVIAHELSHIKHKNHSPAFWREVSRFCPLHKSRRKYLKDTPPQLYQ